jgi:hypothetical protein
MPEHRNEIANNLCNFNNPRSIRSPDVVTAHRPLHHPRIVRPESERRGCPNSQTMASGDLGSPFTASGLSGPDVMETSFRAQKTSSTLTSIILNRFGH